MSSARLSTATIVHNNAWDEFEHKHFFPSFVLNASDLSSSHELPYSLTLFKLSQAWAAPSCSLDLFSSPDPALTRLLHSNLRRCPHKKSSRSQVLTDNTSKRRQRAAHRPPIPASTSSPRGSRDRGYGRSVRVYDGYEVRARRRAELLEHGRRSTRHR